MCVGYGGLGLCFCYMCMYGLCVPIKVWMFCNWDIKLAVRRLSFPIG